MKKRILSIMLITCMIAAIMPVMPTTASAEETGYTVITGTNGYDNEGPENLVDGKINTKWCVNFTEKGEANIIFKAPAAMTVAGYAITTGNDNSENSGRNPDDWVLYGSSNYNETNRTGDWTEIHRVTDDSVLEDKDFTTYYFDLTTPTTTAYQYFKLEITGKDSNADDAMQIGEFTLTSCEHDWKPVTVATTDTEVGYTITKCSKCGWEKDKTYDTANAITLKLEDRYDDDWDGAQLLIRRDGELWKTLTLEDGSSETIYLPYADTYAYGFYWQKGGWDEGVSLTVTVAGAATPNYTKTDFDDIEDGALLFNINTGDYLSVNNAIANIPVDLSIYTEDSVKALRSVVNSVNWEVHSSKQSEIDAMATAISGAIDALVRDTSEDAQNTIHMTNASADLHITENGYYWGTEVSVTPHNGAYRIGGTSAQYKIIIESGSHEITCYELHLSNTGYSPFVILDGASVSLTLQGENELKAQYDEEVGRSDYAGLNVPAGATLEITAQSTGSLLACGQYNGAGIGGKSREGTGCIIISGGTVTGMSESGAGIGSGFYSENSSDGGSGSDGDGDGAGRYSLNRGNDSYGENTIIITGGVVTGQSVNGAGIGSGYLSNGDSTVTISGGIVTGQSEYGAGIGSGMSYSGNNTVTISGGSVTGQSDYGAGLGMCFMNSAQAGNAVIDTITILGGVVNAIGGNDGDYSYGIRLNSGTLTIGGGTVNATGDSTEYGSTGIVMYGGTLTVNGGIVNAIGGESYWSDGICLYDGVLTINGGTVNATGGNGDYSEGIYLEDGTLTINDGTVNAIGGSTTYGSSGICLYDATLTINGGTVNATGSAANATSVDDEETYYGSFGINLDDSEESDASVSFIMTGGRLLAQASNDAENSSALSMEPDLTGYASYQWRNNATGNYIVGNFVWNEDPFDTYVDIMEHIEITLDPNYQGGVFGSAIVGRDGKLTEVLPTLIRDGYTFNGWFTEAESGTAVTAENVFEEDTTIYAHWTANRDDDIQYTATDYSGTYDGQPHSIIVNVTNPSGTTISYSTDGINYSSSIPYFTDEGTYTVYYRITKDGYNTVNGSKTVTINKKSVTITAQNQNIVLGSNIDESKYTVSTGGLVSGDSIIEITLTASTAEITENGTISISGVKIKNASGVDVTGNYDITTVAGTLKITQNTVQVPETGDEAPIVPLFVFIIGNCLMAVGFLKKKEIVVKD